jgi:hypothetical protein
MNTEFDVETVFRLLKGHLKKEGLSYKDIALRLGMSESNLKRIFSTRSCGIFQLAQICVAADTTLLDLFRSASTEGVPHYEFTPEVEAYFVDHIDEFVLFRNISSATNVARYLGGIDLPPKKLEAALCSFERLNLLDRTNGQIRLRHRGYLKLSPSGRLMKKLKQTWVPWFFERVLANEEKKQDDYYLTLSSTGLSRKHKAQLISDIKELVTRYRMFGARDQTNTSSESSAVGICIGIGPHRVGHFEDSVGTVFRS